jgi:cell division protein FtsB
MPAGEAGRPQPRERSRFTSRAAVLAVVICAIALSLAYPVREYIAQRRQIDQLQAENRAGAAELSRLQAEAVRLGDPAYIEQQARDRLHLCMPGQTCYVIIGGQAAAGGPQHAAATATPWYQLLWHSVHAADQGASR